MTVIGLDVALQCPLTKGDIATRLQPQRSAIGAFVDRITDHYMGFYQDAEGFHGCYLHDPLAMVAAIWPDVVGTEPHHVQVVTDRSSPTYGMTATDRRARRVRGEPEEDVALEVDANRVLETVFQTLSRPQLA